MRKKKNKIIYTAVFYILITLPLSARVMEHLDRGLVAVDTGSGIFVSWRMFGTDDPSDIAFNVYRDSTRVNTSPITTTTCYTDAGGSSSSQYYIRAIISGVEQEPSKTVSVWPAQYKEIFLNVPAGGTTPDGVDYTYSPNDCSTGDLDGDGEYEIVLKWYPSNAKDNSQSGYTGNTMLDAYKLDGTHMWRIDLGINIRSGAHYTQFIVYDLDNDGYAEVACKTAPGTKDSSGAYLSTGPAASDNDSADYRNSGGYILDGPEYLTVFNGQTGAEITTVNYIPPRGNVSDWGDSYGNRVDRFLACAAYLDGQNPSLVMCRGYYTRMVLAAWDFDGTSLSNRWVFDTDNGYPSYAGQGNHSLAVGDVDGDGKDEIIYGSCAIDDDGSGLYNTTLGHGDAGHLTDMDPDRPGLEYFQPHEDKSAYGDHGCEYRDAGTGEILWSYYADNDVGRGLAANIDSNYRGYEFWASNTDGVYNINGTRVSTSKPSINFRIFWDGDLLDEILDEEKLDKWTGSGTTRLYTIYNDGADAINGSKANPNLTADLLGDWREEMVYRHYDNTKLLVFTTTIPTDYRFYTFMHDHIYRLSVAWQNVAYNQPPHTGFYVEDGPSAQPPGDVQYPNSTPTPVYTPTATPTDTGSVYPPGVFLCEAPGWASQNGGTTGGGSAAGVTVTTLSQLQSEAASSGAKVIFLDGEVGAGVSDAVSVASDKTIIGLPGAKLTGRFSISDVSNVIIRNISIQGPGAVDVDGVDCITVDNSTNVWLDHLDIYDGQDGNLDVVNGSNYVTVTWCKFYYTAASSNHEFSNLVGNSASKTSDRGHLKVTWLHNWWAENVHERMPRLRFGQNHVVNNLFTSSGNNYCARAGIEADLRIEYNVFNDVNDPVDLYDNNFTAVTMEGNLFISVSGNTSGSGTAFTPPYTLNLIDVNELQDYVSSYAGATLTDLTGCDNFHGATGTPTAVGTFTFTPSVTPTLSITRTRTVTATFTPYPAGYGVIQAEDACAMDGIVESEHEGYYGSGYANLENITGSSIMFSLDAASAISLELNFRYAGGSSNNRNMEIYVNGVLEVSNIDFMPTGAWTSWETSSAVVNLSAGYNEITLVSLTDEGAPNLDLMSWVSEDVVDGGCVEPTATFSPTNSQVPAESYTPTHTATGSQVPSNSFTPTLTATGSQTPTESFTPTHTATGSQVPSNSFTPTLTATGSQVPTDSFTPILTATGSQVPTDSFTPTLTATGSQTPGNSFTPTVTFTFTNTSIQTMTSTPSLIFTPTFTYTYTPGDTATATFTITETEEIMTPTFTSTQPEDTATFTPTNTPIDTAAFTPTNTGTAPITQTHTYSPTITPTPTGTLPAQTFTPTITVSASATLAVTMTYSQVPTESFTPTHTPTGSQTPSNSFTPTLTDTASQVPTESFTPTLTATNSQTPSNSFTPTITMTGTQAATESFTPTITATQQQDDEKFEIKELLIYPNPCSGTDNLKISFVNTARINFILIKIYTLSKRQVRQVNEEIVFFAGENEYTIQQDVFYGLSRGLYYIRVYFYGEEGKKGHSDIKKVVFLN